MIPATLTLTNGRSVHWGGGGGGLIKGLRAACREGKGGWRGFKSWVFAAISKKIKLCPKFKKLEAPFNYRSLGSPVARDRLNKTSDSLPSGAFKFL